MNDGPYKGVSGSLVSGAHVPLTNERHIVPMCEMCLFAGARRGYPDLRINGNTVLRNHSDGAWLI